MKITFEILPNDGKFVLVRQPSGLILFSANSESEVRAHFMKMKSVYCK